ncbi:MAG: glycosyltransferase family 2 protein, partial [Lachnospiraceae bacterium]|nr:glycosyltransferase family 2 protein [Lachnospiraceae bacterium]
MDRTKYFLATEEGKEKFMIQVPESVDYKEAYEKEHKKNAKLAARIAALEEEKDLLEFKLGRIKNNPLWKHTTGLRKVMHLVLRQTTRVKNCGGLRGIAAKIDYKKREAKAKKQFGTQSFPDEKERKLQENALFEKMVTISILVPLYNTPKDFLCEMIESVLEQTYGKWQLCLGDGS